MEELSLMNDVIITGLKRLEGRITGLILFYGSAYNP